MPNRPPTAPLVVAAAPDSFKECLRASEAAAAIQRGVNSVLPGARVILVPMADGGEGTVDAIVAARQGSMRVAAVAGPLGDIVEARYGWLAQGPAAVMEMAEAAGLHLVPPDRRDPLQTTTQGLGELMRAAMEAGARQIVLGIGGSATCDGGAGMAQALGWRLLDEHGHDLPPGGGALERLARIDGARIYTGLKTCAVRVACDVNNPLYGPTGAAHVYAPQKGAGPEAVEKLDAGLRRLAALIQRDVGKAVGPLPGAGAAGGLGAGLAAFAGGTLEPGAPLVAEACGLEAALKEACVVITGEGALDEQTIHGKTIAGVCEAAARHGLPVIALAGTLRPGYEALYERGLTAAFAISDGPMTLQTAYARAGELLSQAAANAIRMFLIPGGPRPPRPEGIP